MDGFSMRFAIANDDPNASVDEADALFMFGACAAFISYLIGKAKSQPPAAKRGPT
jgi:hypothetical protein